MVPKNTFPFYYHPDEPGKVEQVLGMRPWNFHHPTLLLSTTKAEKVDGGYKVNGRKIFASLSGAASDYNITCIETSEDEILFLAISADDPGVEIVGDWDPLGMRGTVSRTLLFKDAFAADDAVLLPPGLYNQLAERWPYVYMTLTPAYMGLSKAVIDFVRDYMSSQAPPGVTSRRDVPQKQQGWAELQIMYERSRALFDRVVEEAGVDPTPGRTAKQTSVFIKAELAKWAPIIKRSGARID